ncbi:hypothetical protein [Sulfurospirillum arcachonense]|uniref:hypothetical protein n=1 Tax=Sulfurospirillum arcachonense TaxID=57666 RepID=UPI00046ACF3D|nr:hypothetical protein [Sulfurospirillum arcachonense]
MKRLLQKTALLFLISFLFFGCAQKIDPMRINKAILPTPSHDTTLFLTSKVYNTYDEKEGKISTYYFKIKEGQLAVSDEITYIPMDYTDQLYNPFSNVTLILNRLTDYKAKTIEEGLDIEVAKHNFTRLYNDKNEYIIGNHFASEIKFAIRRFEEKIQRQEDRRMRISKRIRLPLL